MTRSTEFISNSRNISVTNSPTRFARSRRLTEARFPKRVGPSEVSFTLEIKYDRERSAIVSRVPFFIDKHARAAYFRFSDVESSRVILPVFYSMRTGTRPRSQSNVHHVISYCVVFKFVYIKCRQRIVRCNPLVFCRNFQFHHLDNPALLSSKTPKRRVTRTLFRHNSNADMLYRYAMAPTGEGQRPH